MKHIQLFEEFVNEARAKVEKTEHGDASIEWNGKEVIFSSSKETLNAVIDALEHLQKQQMQKLNWWHITSDDGDIYMERKPESKVFTLSQDDGLDVVQFEVPVSEINNIVKSLKKLSFVNEAKAKVEEAERGGKS
jgi:hypothetical protein